MTMLSEEQLKNLSKEDLVAQAKDLQEQRFALSKQVDFLTEQVMLMNQRQFGRGSDKTLFLMVR